MKAWITLFMAVLVIVPALGQGTLDGDFDADGKLTYDFNGGNDVAYGVAAQPDGKILVGCYVETSTDFDFFLMRLNEDGSFDNTFSSDGKVNTNIGDDDQATTVLIQSDGKIILAGISDLVGGTSQFAMVRYNSDGSIDNNFGTAGKVVTPLTNSGGQSICYGGFLQPDGKIVLTGFAQDSAADYNFAVVRYNSDGSLDNSFSVDGKVTTDFGSTLDDQGVRGSMQADGKIVLAGIVQIGSNNEFGVVRYNTDGTLDNTFGTNGRAHFDLQTGGDLAVLANVLSTGKILVSGTSTDGTNSPLTLIMLNSDGTLDNSFSSDGKVFTSTGDGQGVAWMTIEQPDGKILACGTGGGDTSDFVAVRYSSDGTLDNSFGTNGITVTDFGAFENGLNAALQPNGRLVISGYSSLSNSNVAVARYLTGLNIGIEDLAKNSTSLLIYPNPVQSSAVFEYELAQQDEVTIQLQDMQGRVLHTFINAERPAGSNQDALSFPAGLSRGNYFLSLQTGHGDATIQITVQ